MTMLRAAALVTFAGGCDLRSCWVPTLVFSGNDAAPASAPALIVRQAPPLPPPAAPTTDDQAATIYKALYWDAIRGDQIALQPLANILFDFNVNAGAQAVRLLQRVLNDLGASPQLAIDGVMGAGTAAAIGKADAYAVYARYKQGRVDYYKALVERRPSLQKFLKGWLARVASFPDLSAPTGGSH